uniref:Uncharacterized protein n=1 Tax=Steinernema glaseri TaxID=37863 RepID=A0A1I7YWB8_9BILA
MSRRSQSLISRDPRLVFLQRCRFSFSRMVEALHILHNQSGDRLIVGSALWTLAAMRIPGELVVKYQIVPKTFPHVNCAYNGELARAARDRLMISKELFYARSGRQQLASIPLNEIANRENKALDRRDSRRSRQ